MIEKYGEGGKKAAVEGKLSSSFGKAVAISQNCLQKKFISS